MWFELAVPSATGRGSLFVCGLVLFSPASLSEFYVRLVYVIVDGVSHVDTGGWRLIAVLRQAMVTLY